MARAKYSALITDLHGATSPDSIHRQTMNSNNNPMLKKCSTKISYSTKSNNFICLFDKK